MPSLCQTAAFFAAQVAILVFANWAGPEDPIGAWFTIWRAKWWLTSAGALALAAILVRWYTLAPWKAVAIAVPTAPVGHVVKKLIVLGPGCPRCDTLAKLTRQAADQLALEYQLAKLTDIKQYAAYGLMMTPGLVVDGQLKVQGKVPSLDEIKALLG